MGALVFRVPQVMLMLSPAEDHWYGLCLSLAEKDADGRGSWSR